MARRDRGSQPCTRRGRRSGLTLVEVAVLVCVVGVILAVFVPTFLRELRTSKTSEASMQLGALHRATASYWDRRFEKPSGHRVSRCLPDPAGPTPETVTPDGVDVDFTADGVPGSATWAALGFGSDHPVRYRYTFAPEAWGCQLAGQPGRTLVTLRAEGDLDGDGKHSLFERRATVNDADELVPLGVLHAVDRVE